MPPWQRSGSSDFGVRMRRAAEYVVVPLFALLVSAVLFSCFLDAVGKSPADFYALVWRGGFGTAFSFQNTLQRAAPLILTALAMAIPARIGLIMIGGEGALVLSGFAAAAIALPLISWAPSLRAAADDGAGGDGGRSLLGRARRLPAAHARRQRDHLFAAPHLHRHRHHELLRRGRAARSGLGQQAVDLSDRRRQHDRHDPRHRRALGPRRRCPAGDRALRPDVAHHLRLRCPHHRRQSARRAGAGPAGGQADRRLLDDRGGAAPASPGSSRSQPSTGAPTPRWRRATASPASWCRSWRGTIRWPSSRSPSCSAALPRPAA